MLDPAVTTLLNVDKVTQVFETGSGEARAPVLSDVSLSLKTGEIVALLGRSGSGKSTHRAPSRDAPVRPRGPSPSPPSE